MTRTSSCAAFEILFAAGRLDLQRQAVSRAAKLQKGGQRDHDEIVLILAQHRTELSNVPMTVNSWLAVRMVRPNGLTPGKRFRPWTRQSGRRRRVMILRFAEVAALVQRSACRYPPCWACSRNGRVVDLLVLIFYGQRGIGRRAHIATGVALLGHCRQIVRGDDSCS